MMVGYCNDHAEGVYQMLNLSTHRISTSRDVTWLNKNYGQYIKEESDEESLEDSSVYLRISSIESKDDDSSSFLKMMTKATEDADSEKLVGKEDIKDEGDDSSSGSSGMMLPPPPLLREAKAKSPDKSSKRPATTSDRVLCSHKRAAELMNTVIDAETEEDLSEIAFLVLDEDDVNSAQTLIDELNEQYDNTEYAYFSAFESDYLEPANYREMMKVQDKDDWLKGCNKKLENLKKRKVWEIIKKSDVPANRTLIGNKWVFKRSRKTLDHRSRLVKLGYTQIPGVDFTDNFSPVVHDVTLRVALVLWIILDMNIDQMDVETTFLEGELKESEWVYMKCPTGMKLDLSECLLVKKGMHGLVQAARIFWIRFSTHLTSDKVAFENCQSDQCLFYKVGKFRPIILRLYVDDSACLGHPADIKTTMMLISEEFKITSEGKLNDFLGCDIIRREKEKTCWLLQPHLIKKLSQKYGHLISKFSKTLTLGSPRKIMHKCKDTEERLNEEDHSEYRSGVGSLLYLLKHFRPELSNPI